jgi:hypothetical protein
MSNELLAAEAEITQLKFALEQETARAEQLGINCMWLVERIDSIHLSLCSELFGGWQARADQCVTAAKLLKEETLS